MMWQTFGHEGVKNLLNKQLELGSLSHAYLFSGPEGVGKKLLALEFAKKVLQTEKLENHPDFQMLDAEGEITIEPVLAFISRLGYKPFLGQKKIAVINNAENLNLQSSNALLKTLEEPSKSTVIVLIANSGRLLPTIVSRCQVLNFSAFGLSALEKFGATRGLEINQKIIDLSFGRLARLKRLAEDSAFLEEQNHSVELFEKIKQLPLGDKLAGLNDLAQKETLELQAYFLTWLFWQSGQIAQRPQDFTKVQALGEAIAGLGRNFNKKLVLQGLMMKI